MSTFTSTFDRFKELPEKVVRGTLISLTNRIIERSPVDTGRFRGNWQFTTGKPASRQLSNTDKKGGKRQAALQKKILALEIGRVYYITNNLPYGERLEFGSSNQAPQGMVRVTLAEFDAFLKKAAGDA